MIIIALIALSVFVFTSIMIIQFIAIDDPGKCDYAVVHFHDISNNKVFEHLHPVYETYFCTWIMIKK